MTYISTSKQDLYKEIDNTFGISQATSLKSRLQSVSEPSSPSRKV